LGSVRELIDNVGSVQARINYDPYGTQNRIAGDLESDFGFTGHFYDALTRLYLAKLRAYNPELARWLSRDPLPNAEKLLGPNLYAYVDNNPTNWIDPSGNGPLEFFRCLLNGGVLGDCFGDEKERFRCREVKEKAIKDCTKAVLENPCYPLTGNHDAFWDCINGILRHAGCLPA
jgi:RHS repeat-associated protein